MNNPPGISVLILTKNEEQNLPGCLASVAWCDDIHVYDSVSTDGTVEIARRFGARITERPFDNWAAHQNWGLQNIPFAHPWVFYIDADERMTPQLVQAVQSAVASPGSNVAFQVQRRDFFMGRWLKHVQTSPFYMRLFRPEKMHYERLVNPVSVPDGPVGRVAGLLDHYPFSKGLVHWVERHNSYSTLEALQILEDREGTVGGTAAAHVDKDETGAPSGGFSLIKAFTARDFHERRRHQKALFYRLPCRPLLKFLVLYVGRLGFLDGRAGYTYARLQSIYEYLIVLKTHELEKEHATRRGATGPPKI